MKREKGIIILKAYQNLLHSRTQCLRNEAVIGNWPTTRNPDDLTLKSRKGILLRAFLSVLCVKVFWAMLPHPA
jgi:hypothetical protein